MASAVSPLQHWSAAPGLISESPREAAERLSFVMGITNPEHHQMADSIRDRKATILKELSLFHGIEAERVRLWQQDVLGPDFERRIADLETAEAEAGQKLASSEAALKEAQSLLESAERERDAAKANFFEVCEKLRKAGKGNRTALSERKRTLQIDASKRSAACVQLQESADRAQAQVEQDMKRISRIREERGRLFELRRSQGPVLLRLKERWEQARAKIDALQADLDRSIERFISTADAGEPPEEQQILREFLQRY